MRNLFTVVAQTGSVQEQVGRVTDHDNFGFSAVEMLLNTLSTAANEAPPALKRDHVMRIGSQLLQITILGWLDRFAALFVDPATNLQTFVTLRVVLAGLATIGCVDPETGQPIIPAFDYFRGSR